jgi:hypothetical protein
MDLISGEGSDEVRLPGKRNAHHKQQVTANHHVDPISLTHRKSCDFTATCAFRTGPTFRARIEIAPL